MTTSGKEVLRQIHAHFTQSSGNNNLNAPQQVTDVFPNYNLPTPLVELIDTYLSSFATNYAGADETGSSSVIHARDRERIRWRDSLTELWTTIEPNQGSEGEPIMIARVSCFLILLDKLSSQLKDDDDSTIVTRDDIGKVWWDLLLRRVLLGLAQDDTATTTDDHHRPRGRKTRDTKTHHLRTSATRDMSVSTTASSSTSAAASTTSAIVRKPLTVSRDALAAAMRMIVWGMSPTIKQVERDPNGVPPFCDVIKVEFEKRGTARMRGGDEWYGLRNLSECAYFDRCAPYISPTQPARMPFLSLLLNVLARHSGKAYHVLQTPLLTTLINFCLTTPSPASIALGMKCLQIFLVSLPVIIGDHLFGIMAVYGRAISWESPDVDETLEGAQNVNEEAYDGPSPNPIDLFTLLYGIYPCNFVAFLKDANGYLRSKEWKAPQGFSLTSGVVRERSHPLIRQHALHPALLTGDMASELTDTNRWRRLETADVMAECHRNVIQQLILDDDDDEENLVANVDRTTELDEFAGDGDSLLGIGRSRPRQRRTPFAQDLHELLQLSSSRKSSSAGRSRNHEDSGDVTERPDSHASLARKTSLAAAASRSRSPTPHLPTHTHFTNFQALQSASPPSQSPGRSVSRLRQPDFDSLAFQGNLASADSSAPTSRAHSRASSILNSPTSPLGTVAPSLPTTSSASATGSTTVGQNTSSASSTMFNPEPTLSRSNSKATQHTNNSATTMSLHPLASSSLITTGGAGMNSSMLGFASTNITHSQIHKLETEIILLQGEVAFQSYLKQLHIAHMGTLHREKVLESGAEAERQVLYRTIRTLRAQLKQTKSSLDQLRSETGSTKSNWTSHIEDLKERLKTLRDSRLKWEQERKELKDQVEQANEREKKAIKELEVQGAAYFDLQNQVHLDKEKLDRISEYEARIEALTKTLAICDEDMVNFSQQKQQMNQLAREWKKSELLRESIQFQFDELVKQIRHKEQELDEMRRQQRLRQETLPSTPPDTQSSTIDDWTKLQTEVERLRELNIELMEKLVVHGVEI
ncbi:hypothetical protein OIO90_002829 [Microbotryomycetes sp. JL221]|nr:hypothetical protein OIO90_002829 [Microbotryomycetes sp. JL221]